MEKWIVTKARIKKALEDIGYAVTGSGPILSALSTSEHTPQLVVLYLDKRVVVSPPLKTQSTVNLSVAIASVRAVSEIAIGEPFYFSATQSRLFFGEEAEKYHYIESIDIEHLPSQNTLGI
jgi:hypothetical protein